MFLEALGRRGLEEVVHADRREEVEVSGLDAQSAAAFDGAGPSPGEVRQVGRWIFHETRCGRALGHICNNLTFFFRTRIVSTSRSLLPQGFTAFRADLGERIRRARKDDFGKQQALADAVGISRESLSRIECGRAWPLPDTLDAIMRLMGWDWGDVAHRGATSGSQRRLFDGTWRDDHLLDLCRAMRAGRKARGLSVAQAAELAGISTAQLSRIERGQCRRSRVLEEMPEDRDDPVDKRRMRFRDAFLRELAAAGAGRAS